jgi:hypothetical protein
LQNVITYMADNATGADIPYNLTLKYVMTSNASGNSEGQFLTGYRYVPKNAPQIIRPTIRRSPSQSDDIYTFYHGGYDIIPFASTNNLIGSGQKQFAYTDALDANVTLSRAGALALLGTKFTISGTTITVNQNATYDELYDASKAFKFQGTTTAFETPTVGSLIVTPNGSSLTAFTGWTLVVNSGVTLSEGAKFNFIRFDTVTLNGTITGVYQTSAGTSTILELRGVAEDASIYVGNASTGITTLFQADVAAGTYRAYFAPGVTAPQLIVREKYGIQRESEVIPLTGGLIWYQFVDVPDVGISQTTQATVQAYTSIENADKFYDRTALFRLTEQGIKLGQIVTRDGNAINVSAPFSVLINQSAADVYDILGDTITLKASGYANGTRYTNTVLVPPATLEADTNEVLSADFEDANGDSAVTILGGDGDFELWKVTTATATADYETGTKLADVTNEKYRFTGVSGFDIVGIDINSNVRRRTSMAKGVYTQSFYVGDQIQLAQAPQVVANGLKLDLLAVEIEAIQGTGFNPATNSLVALGTPLQADDYDTGEIADAVWNEVLTGGTHNVAGSAGRRLRTLADTVILIEGTGEAMSNAGGIGSITLPDASTVCIKQAIRVGNQVRFVRTFDPATKLATVDKPWCEVIAGDVDYTVFSGRDGILLTEIEASEILAKEVTAEAARKKAALAAALSA